MFLMCLIITWAHAIIYELLNQHNFRPSSHVKLRLAVMYIRNGSSMLEKSCPNKGERGMLCICSGHHTSAYRLQLASRVGDIKCQTVGNA